MQLLIKNMVCPRCIQAVQQAAEMSDIDIEYIRLGELESKQVVISPEQLDKFDSLLIELGFERYNNKDTQLAEKVKMIVIEQIHHNDEELHINWSKLIEDNLHYKYNYTSNIFSQVEGITIEKFIIRQKIERIKELLSYDELTLTEIAYRLGYSSASYLANQFRKITGMTPGAFRKLLDKNRSHLDHL
jgi:AraC-like DNA-binding protein